jgi:threonine-phosphate decarboxylase
MLERYGHGGDVWTAAEAFGVGKELFLDFSSNMNPFGPPPVVEEVIRRHWKDIARYPDPAVRELRAKLAGVYGIPAESILVGNGAAELIDLLVQALKPEVTGLAKPSFSEYEEAVRKVGGRIHLIHLHAQDGFLLQREALKEAVRFCDLLFLGHPNNPTGRLVSPELLQLARKSGRLLALDEAFIDFVPEEDQVSMIREAADDPNLIVIRSMTKFYAVPGIRLGFMVAHPDLVRRLKKQQVHWSVNFLAQLIGRAVLDEQEYAVQTRRWLQEERPWLTGRLERLGLSVVPSATNFLLFSFPPKAGLNVKTAQRYLGERGILIRDASLFPGLDDSYCRIAVRLREENERLLDGLEEAMQSFALRGGGRL